MTVRVQACRVDKGIPGWPLKRGHFFQLSVFLLTANIILKMGIFYVFGSVGFRRPNRLILSRSFILQLMGVLLRLAKGRPNTVLRVKARRSKTY